MESGKDNSMKQAGIVCFCRVIKEGQKKRSGRRRRDKDGDGGMDGGTDREKADTDTDTEKIAEIRLNGTNISARNQRAETTMNLFF